MKARRNPESRCASACFFLSKPQILTKVITIFDKQHFQHRVDLIFLFKKINEYFRIK